MLAFSYINIGKLPFFYTTTLGARNKKDLVISTQTVDITKSFYHFLERKQRSEFSFKEMMCLGNEVFSKSRAKQCDFEKTEWTRHKKTRGNRVFFNGFGSPSTYWRFWKWTEPGRFGDHFQNRNGGRGGYKMGSGEKRGVFHPNFPQAFLPSFVATATIRRSRPEGKNARSRKSETARFFPSNGWIMYI